MMNEQLAKQLTRQLRLLNFWITFFGVIILASLAVSGYFMYRAYTYVKKAESSLTSLQQKAQLNVDVQDKLCNSKSSFSGLIKEQSTLCN